MQKVSIFDQVLESIEVLSTEEQEMLIGLIRKRLSEKRRDEIAKNIVQAEEDYKAGNVFRGTAEEVIAELNL